MPETANSNDVLMSPASPNANGQNTDGSLSPKAPAAVTSPTPGGDKDAAAINSSLYESADLAAEGGSVQRRMESIPEEDASKANLHSSHSKVGPHAQQQIQQNQSHASVHLQPRPLWSADGTTVLNQQQFA